MKIIATIAMLFSLNSFADTISFRADNYCPYNCDPTSKDPGYLIELLNATLGKAGHKIDYQILAWNRAVSETAEGKFNGILASNADDIKGAVNTEPVGSSKTCFFVKKTDSFKYKDVASLKGKKVGVIKDYKYFDELDADIAKRAEGFDVSFGDEPLNLNIRKLDAGRIDLVVEAVDVFNYVSHQEKMDGKFVSAGCVTPTKLYISFSPKQPKSAEYAKAFNSGVEALRASGEFKKILEKYKVSDWK